MHVLIIEDDANIAELVSLYMEKEGWRVTIASDGEEGLSCYYDSEPDLLIVDIMLPEVNGLDICRDVRQDDRLVPILILTGKGETDDIVRGLDAGADDYLVKPFEPKELLARVKSLLRRSFPYAGSTTFFTAGNTSLSPEQHEWRINGELIAAAPREIRVLSLLVHCKGQTLSREQILDPVWGKDFDGDPRTVDVHMKRIREKLRTFESDWSLVTVRGVGYRIETGRSS
ncbi:response regulator transcription factor [Salisediminibacterium selenitireducens]|uniref:Two component transcriptional regulator, winged helix family n=1 Tax=Bacillus selenitireducens (strain ATCC 700615 / DSM 15326 / MLS10) TaxID=439292 RepID=D6XYN0_BACIE|nr:response regulator transcription factor [Salisediminibacterium selenitireducens]ADH98188.1 two component transcriptional regulator, winged helix family [[Bacillus] selenitireducens MLS10]